MRGGEERRRAASPEGAARRRGKERAGAGEGPDRGSSRGNQGAPSSSLIRFGEFELDVESGELRRAGAPVRIAAKPFSMLCYLAAHKDRAVPKQELRERLWPGVSVSDAAVSSALKDLRRALGDDGSRSRIVKTVRGRGLRFVPGMGIGPEEIGRPARASPTFVGRARELRRLVRCAEEAARGRPQVVLIVGAGGAGKSRLVDELARDPCCAGFTLARGESERATATPYAPFAQALRKRILAGEGTEARSSDGDAALRRLLYPGQDETYIPWRPERSDGTRERSDLFAVIWRLLQELARDRPTLLVIEDLHQADVASLELLANLAVEISDARTEGGVPLLLVATTQPPQPGDRLELTLRRLERQRGCTSIELAGFGTRATGELLAVLGVANPRTLLSKSAREKTGGNPFFIEQLLRGTGGVSALSPAVIAAHGDLIADALAQLSDECRGVLTVAAFIGDSFGLLVLGAMTRRSPEDTALTLLEAIRLGLVLGERRSFRFEHTLVRDALCDATTEEQRAGLHHDLAGVHEDLYSSGRGEHAMEIAKHLVLAGDRVDPARLVSFARRAGDQAFAVCAWHDSAYFYDAVLAANSRLAVAELAELQILAGLAASRDGASRRALLCFQNAAEAFKTAGDELGFAWAIMYAARALFAISPIGSTTRGALHELETVVARLGERQPALRGRLLETLAEGAFGSGETQLAEDLAEQALEIGSSIDDPVVCFNACVALARARYAKMHLRAAVASWLEAEGHARRSCDPWLQSLPRPGLALSLQRLGRFHEARTRGIEAESMARRAHNSGELSFVLAQQAALELASGNFAAADEQAREALSHCTLNRHSWGRGVAHSVAACAAAQRGKWNDAATALSKLEPGTPSPDDAKLIGVTIPSVWRELVLAYRAPEQIDRDGFAELVRRVEAVEVSAILLPAYAALAEVAAILEARRESRAMERPLQLAYAEGFVFVGPWIVLIGRLLAGCAVLDGRLDDAEHYFAQAIQAALASGARIELARTLIDRARMHARHGDGRRSVAAARADLSAGALIARELGLRPLERSARALARELGASTGRPGRNP